ncbi:hypothetical protein K1T35_47885 (plasmid) [Pseudonocardia sp. DSM 110487]|uniref:hypothetical protein n=1 Tax=Pseudonocardia sp. DSM 110487 TaxID=2865833 RepID=UPI001C6A240A|nr:hypothetical protein [Pseudonocardia sp. DSM 110487]QYN41072.1 hypothetical protein K1T35_47885 [Pseudonocardia sp. DSM 110487]
MITAPNAHAALALSTGGAQSFLADNIVPLVLLGIGLILIALSIKADMGKIVTIVLGAAIGLGVVGLSVIPGGTTNIARFVAGLFTGG